MNAPFVISRDALRIADLAHPGERERIEAFVASHPDATPFHRPAWLEAVARGTGNAAVLLVQEGREGICGYLPLSEVHSPVFGRMLASSGFAVNGGLLACEGADPAMMFAAAEELAQRRSCPTIELRGGVLPHERERWAMRSDAHCNFISELEDDDEAQLLSITRRQRAEIRKGLKIDFDIAVGRSERDREEHYAIYAESVRNLGTPVFPKSLFDAVIDGFGDDAEILTLRHEGKPVASVLSLYHRGVVMPFWGGGIWDARRLRANERMYYELMIHARRRGCTHFDFGRSKTGSGAYHFKKNWGFKPDPMTYAVWTADGAQPRDADPDSAKHRLQIALWKRLPLAVANRLGPLIAQGLG
jgi:FemAB-related protein (PEP-CTERM system-associated)